MTAGGPWIAFHIYPRRDSAYSATEALAAVEKITAEAQSWHYLHFVDAGGFHIRLRLLPNANQRPAEVADSVLVALAPVGDTVFRTVYLPERHKYGSGSQLVAAEELFHHSSCYARDQLSRPRRERVQTAATLMHSVLTTFPDSVSPISFAYHYRWYWSADQGKLPSPRRPRSPTVQGGSQSCTELPDATDELTQKFYALFWRTEMNPYVFLFHHLHLTNNRLGLSRQMEGIAADAVYRTLIAAHSHTRNTIEGNP